MIDRRDVMRLGLMVGPGMAVPGLAAGEFWNDKQPSEWSEKEVERLMTKSPWAREVTPEMDFSGMGGMGPGGPPPGGEGGPPMGPPPGEGTGPGPMGGPPKLQVRWESAEPLRQAGKRKLPEDASGYYVIGMHMPFMRRGPRGPRPGGMAEDPERRKMMEERMKQMRERQKQSTALTPKGKDPIAPERIEFSREDATTLFFFPRQPAITPDDKEVTFVTRMGPMEVKAKFVLKDMLYRGKLAL